LKINDDEPERRWQRDAIMGPAPATAIAFQRTAAGHIYICKSKKNPG
jgi:hypothetical protein